MRVDSRHAFQHVVVPIGPWVRYARDLLERIPEAAPAACADEDGAPHGVTARVPHTYTTALRSGCDSVLLCIKQPGCVENVSRLHAAIGMVQTNLI